MSQYVKRFIIALVCLSLVMGECTLPLQAAEIQSELEQEDVSVDETEKTVENAEMDEEGNDGAYDYAFDEITEESETEDNSEEEYVEESLSDVIYEGVIPESIDTSNISVISDIEINEDSFYSKYVDIQNEGINYYSFNVEQEATFQWYFYSYNQFAAGIFDSDGKLLYLFDDLYYSNGFKNTLIEADLVEGEYFVGLYCNELGSFQVDVYVEQYVYELHLGLNTNIERGAKCKFVAPRDNRFYLKTGAALPAQTFFLKKGEKYYTYASLGSLIDISISALLDDTQDYGELIDVNKESDGTLWAVTEDGTLYINKQGRMSDYPEPDPIHMEKILQPWGKYYGSIHRVVFEEGITYIGAYSLVCMSQSAGGITPHFTEIIIPDSVTEIGKYALNRGICDKEIILPNGLLKIGDYAFNCAHQGAYKIRLNESIQEIGENAFSYCSIMQSKLPDSIKKIGAQAFYACNFKDGLLTLPENCDDIGLAAFETCKKLKKVIVSSGITEIPESAFYNCELLENVQFEDKITKIGSGAFLVCPNLKYINLGENLCEIGRGALAGTALKSVIFPSKLKVIGQEVCRGVPVEKIVFEEGVETIDSLAFYENRKWGRMVLANSINKFNESASGYPAISNPFESRYMYPAAYVYYGSEAERYMKGWSSNIKYIKNAGRVNERIYYVLTTDNELVLIGEGMIDDYESEEAVPWYAFREGIKNVEIDGDITGIGEYTFSGCNKLAKIYHPAITEDEGTYVDNLVYVGTTAFDGCEQLIFKFNPNSETERALNQSGIEFVQENPHGTCGTNVVWLLDSEGCLTLSGKGAMADYERLEDVPWFFSRSKIKSVVIEDGVNTLGTNAFAGCSNLVTVTGLDGITRIGKSCFSGCYRIKEMSMPKLVKLEDNALKGCSALSNLQFGNALKCISLSSLNGCGSLKEVDIPSTVNDIQTNTDFTNSKLIFVINRGDYAQTVFDLIGIKYRCRDDIFVETITVNNDKKEININDTKSFTMDVTVMPENATNKALEYRSNNVNVLDVTEEGVVSVLSSGKASIIVSSTDGSNITARYDVVVTDKVAITSINLNKNELMLDLTKNELGLLDATVLPSGAKAELVWTSTDTDVVVVRSGIVIPIGDGAAVVRCSDTSNPAVYAECNVEVHRIIKDEEVNPTCTEAGLTEGIHCGECEKVIKAQETIEATGIHRYGLVSNENGFSVKCVSCVSASSMTVKVNDVICGTGYTCEDIVVLSNWSDLAVLENYDVTAPEISFHKGSEELQDIPSEPGSYIIRIGVSHEEESVIYEKTFYVRTPFPVQSQKTYEYTGNEQTYDILGLDEVYAVSDNIGIDAGNYRVKYTLIGDNKWEDGSTEPYYINWNIGKIEYFGITKGCVEISNNKGAESVARVPAIPKGASYGTVINTNNDKYDVFLDASGNCKVTAKGIIDEESSFTISVVNAKNYKDFEILITVVPEKHIHLVDLNSYHKKVDADCIHTGIKAFYDCKGGCGAKLEEDGTIISDEEIIIPATGRHTPASAVEENVIAASCSKQGSYDEVIYCAVDECKAEISRTEIITDEADHIDENGDKVCDICGDGVYKNGIWISSIDDQIYTGKVIIPSFSVYDKNKELVLNKDYAIRITNNVNAGKALITITGKGDYENIDTTEFNILPQDITGNTFAIDEMAIKANGRDQKPKPVLTWNGKNIATTGYSYHYFKADGYGKPIDDELVAVKDAGDYVIKVCGEKNFTGERYVKLTVIDGTRKLASSLAITAIKAQPYTGNAIEPVLTVKDGKTELTEYKDYNVEYYNNTNVGKAYAVVTGIGIYSGSKRVSFAITGTPITKATVEGLPTSVTYTGNDIRFDDLKLYIKATLNTEQIDLRKDVDYEIGYINNKKAGVATVVFTGINGYTGVLKKTFRINAFKFAEDNERINVSVPVSVEYSKGGAKPAVVVTFTDDKGDVRTLAERTDYTVAYLKNTAVNDCSNEKNLPTVKVTLKGSFNGVITKNFSITAKDLSEVTAVAADKMYTGKPNAWKSAVAVTDTDGKKLTANRDYESVIAYTYAEDGTTVQTSDIVKAGTVIAAKIKAKEGGNYTGEVTCEYRVTEALISAAKVVKVETKKYTGKEITLSKDDIVIKPTATAEALVYGVDYEIVPGTYTNNIGKGTASVMIRGIGDYGGARKVNFLIKAKGFSWWR